MTERGIKVLRGEKVEHNPVPSILISGIKDNITAKFVEKIIKKELKSFELDIVVVNGVETNKVQPKEEDEWTVSRYRPCEICDKTTNRIHKKDRVYVCKDCVY